MIKTINISCALALLYLIFSFALENNLAGAGSPPNPSWLAGNHIEINLHEHDQVLHKWIIKILPSYDVLIESEIEYDNEAMKGTLAIIGGRMMIVKRLVLKRGYEIDVADGPALTRQLLLNLLSQALPDGPSTIKSPLAIDHLELENDIKVATPSASGVYGAPWIVTGSVVPGEGMSYKYDLEFTFKSGDEDHDLRFTGTWALDDTLKELGNDMSLAEWKAYKIGLQIIKSGNKTIYDYGAQPVSQSFPTIADLKRYIEDQESSKKEQK